MTDNKKLRTFDEISEKIYFDWCEVHDPFGMRGALIRELKAELSLAHKKLNDIENDTLEKAAKAMKPMLRSMISRSVAAATIRSLKS